MVLATLAMGLMAGLFAAFSYAVMPGLGRAEDRAFVDVMRHINRAIVNGWFLSCYLGAFVFTVVAAVLNIGDPALVWILPALPLYLGTFVITAVVNVPLNNQLEREGDRAAFERRWVLWNVVRTVTTVLAFLSLIAALLET